MKTLFVRDLQKNQMITKEPFVILKCEFLDDKNGHQYCKLTLGDRTGKIDCKIWSERLAKVDQSILKEGSIVLVSAKVDDFKGKAQLTILEVEPVDGLAIDDFIETSDFDVNEMISDFDHEVEKIRDQALRAVLQRIFNDQEIRERFIKWPAAETVHHDFRSGLLQHVLEMVEISKSLVKFYPKVNYDILKAGIFLHDLGKIYELDATGVSTKYSKMGNLIGHIVCGVMIFDKYGGKELPEDTYLHIVHLILSHHGSREFGSPVVPSTVEAIMLSDIDNLSAKSRTALKARDGLGDKDEFTAHNYFLENAKIWKGTAVLPDEDLEGEAEDTLTSTEQLKL